MTDPMEDGMGDDDEVYYVPEYGVTLRLNGNRLERDDGLAVNVSGTDVGIYPPPRTVDDFEALPEGSVVQVVRLHRPPEGDTPRDSRRYAHRLPDTGVSGAGGAAAGGLGAATDARDNAVIEAVKDLYGWLKRRF